jgi:hypothetical protein
LRSVGCTTEHCQYALESVIRMNHLELNLNVLHGTTPGSLAAAAACAGCRDLSRGWRSSLQLGRTIKKPGQNDLP